MNETTAESGAIAAPEHNYLVNARIIGALVVSYAAAALLETGAIAPGTTEGRVAAATGIVAAIQGISAARS